MLISNQPCRMEEMQYYYDTIKNNPKRKFKSSGDVLLYILLHGSQISWSTVQSWYLKSRVSTVYRVVNHGEQSNVSHSACQNYPTYWNLCNFYAIPYSYIIINQTFALTFLAMSSKQSTEMHCMNRSKHILVFDYFRTINCRTWLVNFSWLV